MFLSNVALGEVEATLKKLMIGNEQYKQKHKHKHIDSRPNKILTSFLVLLGLFWDPKASLGP